MRNIFKLRGFFGGLLLSTVILIVAIGSLYAIPKYVQPYFSPEAFFETENFRIEFLKDSTVARERAAFGQRLEQRLADVLQALDVDQSRLLGKIELIVRDTKRALSQAFLKRMDPYRGGVPTPAIYLLTGHDPKIALVEYIVTRVWERPSSSMLSTGMILAQSERPFEAQIAALPETLVLSLTDLIKLDQRGLFAGSAGSASAVGLDRAFAQQEEFDEDINALAQAHAVTLVRFLLQTGSIGKFKQLWTRSLSAVQAIYGVSLEDLNTQWRAWVRDRGEAMREYSYYRGTYLWEIGDRDRAEPWLQAAREFMPELAAFQLGRLRCDQGRWAEAHEFFELVKSHAALSDVLSIWEERVLFYEGWQTREAEDFLVHYPPEFEEAADKTLEEAQRTLPVILAQLEMSREQLPSKLVLFLWHVKAPVLADGSTALRGVARLKLGNPVGYELALIALRHWQKEQTYSEVLRRGLAYYLDQSGRDYLSEAEGLSMTREWVPFASLDFEAYSFEAVRVGAAAMIGYLFENQGIERLKELWRQTALLGEDRSLDSALEKVYGISRQALEEELIDVWAKKSP
jgi:tetratricopeptide (TPR) repeat protein